MANLLSFLDFLDKQVKDETVQKKMDSDIEYIKLIKLDNENYEIYFDDPELNELNLNNYKDIISIMIYQFVVTIKTRLILKIEKYDFYNDFKVLKNNAIYYLNLMDIKGDDIMKSFTNSINYFDKFDENGIQEIYEQMNSFFNSISNKMNQKGSSKDQYSLFQNVFIEEYKIFIKKKDFKKNFIAYIILFVIEKYFEGKSSKTFINNGNYELSLDKKENGDIYIITDVVDIDSMKNEIFFELEKNSIKYIGEMYNENLFALIYKCGHSMIKIINFVDYIHIRNQNNEFLKMWFETADPDDIKEIIPFAFKFFTILDYYKQILNFKDNRNNMTVIINQTLNSLFNYFRYNSNSETQFHEFIRLSLNINPFYSKKSKELTNSNTIDLSDLLHEKK